MDNLALNLITRFPNHFIKRVWRALVEPFTSLPKVEDRRRAIVTTVFLVLSIIAVGIEHWIAGNIPFITLILLLCGYFLGRTRWFRLAAMLLIVTLTVPSYLIALNLPNPGPNRINSAFAWIVIPLLFCSLIYSVRITILLGGINIGALLLLPLIRSEITYQMIEIALGFYALTSVILITVMIQRNQIETDRQQELIEGRALLAQEAIQRERFAEQAQQRADQLSMVNQISNAISNLQDLESILQLIFEQVRNNIKLDVFFIALHNEKLGLITFPLMFDGGAFWQQPAKDIRQVHGVSKVIETGRPLLWNRTPEEIEAAQNSDNRVGDPSRVAASIVLVPLQAGNRAIGALSVQSYELNAYDEDQVAILTALAQQVTIAIENARLFEEANKRAQRVMILNEIGNTISALSDLPSLLETVYQQVEKTLATDLFFIGLYDAQKNEMSFPIMYDEGRRWEQPPSPVTEATFSGRTILTHQPLLIDHWAASPAAVTSSRIIVGNETKVTSSLMFAPLPYAESVIGVISVQSYKANSYTEEDLSLLAGIANQVAVAIQNTRLLDDIKQNARSLSTLNEIGQAVSELRDLPQLLEVIYAQVKQNLNVDAFYVGLYHPENNTVSYPITYDDGVHYDSKPDAITPISYLYRLLHGEPATLINRKAEELTQPRSEDGMIGDTTRRSASLLIAPLKIHEQIIGVISAQSYTLNAYKKEDLDLLVGIANQVSIAIENSRLYTSAQQEIAERQKVAEQLRAAETKYRELVERIPAVIYSSETGPEGRWFYIGPQIESLLGFTSEEWLASPNLWYQQILPEDRERTLASEAQAIRQGVKIDMDYRIHTKDGRLIWVHDESLNVSISDNQQYIVQGILTDITLRKQAELDLKESEERYHSLFITAERQAQELSLLSEVQAALARELELPELMRTVVGAIASTFGYTFVSLYVLAGGFLHLQHQVGYEAENVIDKISAQEGVSGRVIRTGKPILIKDVADEPLFLRADPRIRSEVCVPLFNGDQIFGILNVESSKEHPLTEADLRVMQILSEQVNIAIRRTQLYTDRDESLRREQHINELAHAISSTIDLSDILEKVTKVSADLVGAETATISLVTDDGMEITNAYNYNEISNLQNLLFRRRGLTWLLYETGQPIILDEYAEHPRASPEWSSSGVHAFMGFPIMMGEKRLGAFAVYSRNPEKKFTQRDFALMAAIAREVAIAIQNARLFEALQKELLERRRIQQEREAMLRDLEAKNAELERFTYTVSHDLKSPLVTIGGFLGFLEEDLRRGEQQRIQSAIQRIDEAAKKMRRLLDELLALSRVGRLANPSSDVLFGELASEAIELTQGQLSAQQVEVRVEADLPTVHVDRVRMIEVLQNMIVNATKFMGGQEHPLIEIGMAIRDGQRAFFVKDNGIGIAPIYHTKIFGLFEKLDPASEGTGIGLALAKRIVEVHGGKIWVESEPGKGATFFFTLKEKNQEEKT